MTHEHKALVALLGAVRQELEEYEQAATGESYNNPKLNAAIESLTSQCVQPQADEAVAWRMRGMRANSEWLPWAMVTAEQAERWRRDPSFKNGRLQIEPLYASPQPANLAQVTDALDEGLEILGNLIDNITRHGNYSPESTCMFIDQAGQTFRKARTTLTQTEADNA